MSMPVSESRHNVVDMRLENVYFL